ncbi:MAG: ComEC/Rec2 family competence protein [Bacteroidales bacterium]|nr:ComEC/Rec2 family competence protein [Bacteroidales bacterium]
MDLRRLGVAITFSFLLGTVSGGFASGEYFPLILIPVPGLLYLCRKRASVFILLSCAAFFVLGIQRRAVCSETISPAEQYIENKAFQIKENISARLSQRLENQSSKAIASALLLGDKTGLDWETRTAFRNAGISHALALSGMHVGIIWSIICALTAVFRCDYRARKISFALSIAVIFLYALITGLSPSVSRACIMIAVWKTADIICHSKDKIAPLLIAAFAIALFNPLAVRMIGFQLSFAAVAGIVYLYPAVEESIEKVIVGCHKRRTVRRILAGGAKLMGITMTCQIATFPLILIYFGKISGNFLISNLVCAPLVTLSVYGSAASALLGGLPAIGEFISGISSAIIETFRQVVLFLGS